MGNQTSRHDDATATDKDVVVNTRSLRSATRKQLHLQEIQKTKKNKKTDAGKLELLPREIRDMIYKLVLVDSDVIKLKTYQPREDLDYVINGVKSSRRVGKEVAPVKHKRNNRRRGQQWKTRGKSGTKAWVEVPAKNSLLLVNKQVQAEAAQILYRCNTFAFENLKALEFFGAQIGDVNKLYLSNIELASLPSLPWNHDIQSDTLPSQERAMLALASSSNLRSISINALPELNERDDAKLIGMHVEACMPLLWTLQKAYRVNKIKADVFEVLKIKSGILRKKFHADRAKCTASCQRCAQRRRRIDRARTALRSKVARGFGFPSCYVKK